MCCYTTETTHIEYKELSQENHLFSLPSPFVFCIYTSYVAPECVAGCLTSVLTLNTYDSMDLVIDLDMSSVIMFV